VMRSSTGGGCAGASVTWGVSIGAEGGTGG
jgi:hypothetical protein